jgi:serine/threonine protein kinase
VLIDFGAARQTLSADTPLLKPMYTPGFAAPEQYNGPARAARAVDRHLLDRRSMYACMAAAAPQAADQRLERDQLPAGAQGAGRTSIRANCWTPWTGACA